MNIIIVVVIFIHMVPVFYTVGETRILLEGTVLDFIKHVRRLEQKVS